MADHNANSKAWDKHKKKAVPIPGITDQSIELVKVVNVISLTNTSDSSLSPCCSCTSAHSGDDLVNN